MSAILEKKTGIQCRERGGFHCSSAFFCTSLYLFVQSLLVETGHEFLQRLIFPPFASLSCPRSFPFPICHLTPPSSKPNSYPSGRGRHLGFFSAFISADLGPAPFADLAPLGPYKPGWKRGKRLENTTEKLGNSCRALVFLSLARVDHGRSGIGKLRVIPPRSEEVVTSTLFYL